MTSKSKFRPSPAMIVSCVALTLALVGTAVAAPKLAVRSAQIVNGTVRTVDLGKDAVKSPKIADATVSAADLGPDSVGSEEIAKDAVTAEEIAENAVGSSEVADQSLTKADLGGDSVGAGELGGTVLRTNTVAIPAGTNRSVSVTCPAGEQVVSGGGQPTLFGVEMTSSRPSGNGWLYQARNNTASNASLTVFALCLAP